MLIHSVPESPQWSAPEVGKKKKEKKKPIDPTHHVISVTICEIRLIFNFVKD
jgi:hypothetical protein